MARISTYTNASPVTLSDKFIGTEVAGTPVNVTKNFLISDLLALFQSNITLQNVLDAGNTATQSIILTGDITQTGNFSITGGALSLGGTVRDFNGALGNNGETLVCNASGQLVFGSGLTNQNLSQVLAIGNTATNDIILTGDIIQTGGEYNLTGDFTQTGGDYTLTGNITQTGGDYTLTGNITQTGNINLTGNYQQVGTMRLTGDMIHTGPYSYSGGQFFMGATGTMVLGGPLTCNSSISLTGTVKDYNDTLGGNKQILVSDSSGQVTWQDSVPTTVRSSALTTTNIILDDKNGVVITTAATATDVRIPTNAGAAFPIGTKITIIQEGAGTVTVVGTAGVTLQSSQGHDKLSHQYSVATVVKTATDTWYLYGEIKA